MVSIAVIGAGLSGLVVANLLKDNAKVTIFEKARGASGRLSTRRAEPYFFDHGAQFFKAKTPEFQAFLTPMMEQGIIKEWNARFVEFMKTDVINKRRWNGTNPNYVGVPGMSAICKYLAKDIDIQFSTRVSEMVDNGSWKLLDSDRNDLGSFDWVISTAPAQQTAELMPKSFLYYDSVCSAKMVSCFTLMLGFNKELPIDFDAALVGGSDISWISVNSSKPGRAKGYSLVIHSTNKWAEEHLHDDRNEIMEYICRHASSIIGVDLTSADHKNIHGWHYANIQKQPKQDLFIDEKQKLAVCGDWCIQGIAEAAFISAFNISNKINEIISGR